MAIASQLGDTAAKIKIRVRSEHNESWSLERSRAGDQEPGERQRKELPHQGEKATFGKGQCRAGAGIRGW